MPFVPREAVLWLPLGSTIRNHDVQDEQTCWQLGKACPRTDSIIQELPKMLLPGVLHG